MLDSDDDQKASPGLPRMKRKRLTFEEKHGALKILNSERTVDDAVMVFGVSARFVRYLKCK